MVFDLDELLPFGFFPFVPFFFFPQYRGISFQRHSFVSLQGFSYPRLFDESLCDLRPGLTPRFPVTLLFPLVTVRPFSDPNPLFLLFPVGGDALFRLWRRLRPCIAVHPDATFSSRLVVQGRSFSPMFFFIGISLFLGFSLLSFFLCGPLLDDPLIPLPADFSLRAVFDEAPPSPFDFLVD